jgi:hypothetical protein
MSRRSSSGSIINNMQFEQENQHQSINNDLLNPDKHLIQIDNQTKITQNSIYITNQNTQIESDEYYINYKTG